MIDYKDYCDFIRQACVAATRCDDKDYQLQAWSIFIRSAVEMSAITDTLKEHPTRLLEFRQAGTNVILSDEHAIWLRSKIDSIVIVSFGMEKNAAKRIRSVLYESADKVAGLLGLKLPKVESSGNTVSSPYAG